MRRFAAPSLVVSLSLAVSACGSPEANKAGASAVAEKAAPKAEAEPKAAEAPAEAPAEAELAPAEPAEKVAEKKPSEKPPIYEERALTDPEIDTLLAQAKKDNKRVLLMFGGNWCGWCHKLHELMDADEGLKKSLAEGYVRVMVDSHTNDPLMERFDVKLEGVPFLVVLDPEGKVLVKQETGSLEEGPKHDPAKVLAFLETWRPQA